MPDPTLVAAISLYGAPVAATLATSKVVRAGQDLAQGGLGDLVQGGAPAMREAWRSIEEPIGPLLGGWKDLSWPRLKILSPKPASGAVMVADDLDTFPDINIPYFCHSAVRKEGL